ncbi:MAG: selenium cofactor biosynthesis protein YqeC [Candidatus Eisenbacteria bacterium]|nr:selenium cofactor biosynthesis protein YqeC [Candidatus Eisenbacteria bacterium]
MTKDFSLLSDALEIHRGQLVALVGGGGKTGAMLTLSRELADRGWRVLASTTTRVGQSVATSMPVLTMMGDEPPEELARAMSESGHAFLSGGLGNDGKLLGVDPWILTTVRDRRIADVVLVEADGARQLPLKAPAEHEPLLPRGVDLVLPVAGLDALGRPIGPGHVHRPELLRQLTDSDVVTPAVIADVLVSGAGGMKGVPEAVEVCPILNKIDTVPLETALKVASAVLAARPDRIRRVLMTNLRGKEYVLVTP